MADNRIKCGQVQSGASVQGVSMESGSVWRAGRLITAGAGGGVFEGCGSIYGDGFSDFQGSGDKDGDGDGCGLARAAGTGGGYGYGCGGGYGEGYSSGRGGGYGYGIGSGFVDGSGVGEAPRL